MDQLASILVGIDFTPCSASALRQAARLAAWNRSSLRAIHVIDTFVVVDLEEALSPYQKDIQQGLTTDAKRAWEKFRASDRSLAAADIPIDIVIGNEAHSILRAVRDTHTSLLVMGIHGSSRQSQATAHRADHGIGELAKACVRSAPCRVLLVDDSHTGPFRTIVVGIDFSPTSLDALQTAIRVAAQDNAALHVVHVFSPPWTKLHYFTSCPEASPDFQAKYRDALRGRLHAAVADLGHAASFIKPALHLLEHSSDGRALTDFATQNNADLLVMGTRGRSDLADVLLGTTAERVLRNAPCSILTVRAGTP